MSLVGAWLGKLQRMALMVGALSWRAGASVTRKYVVAAAAVFAEGLVGLYMRLCTVCTVHVLIAALSQFFGPACSACLLIHVGASDAIYLADHHSLKRHAVAALQYQKGPHIMHVLTFEGDL